MQGTNLDARVGACASKVNVSFLRLFSAHELPQTYILILDYKHGASAFGNEIYFHWKNAMVGCLTRVACAWWHWERQRA